MGNVKYEGSCPVQCPTGYDGAINQWECKLDSNNNVVMQGEDPTCAALPCVDNLPNGVNDNCNGVTTKGECTINCPSSQVGNSQTMVCGTNAVLTGQLPVRTNKVNDN